MNLIDPQRNSIQRWRLYVIYVLVALIFGYYALRLFNIQVVKGADYVARADENRTTDISVPTTRGIIYDRNGFVLARNVASYNVTIVPADLPGDPTVLGNATKLDTDLDPNVQEVYRKLSALIDVPATKGEINDEVVKVFKPCETDLGIAQIVYIADTLGPYNPVRIKCNIDEQVAMTIRARASDLPGVGIEVEAVREGSDGGAGHTQIPTPVPRLKELNAPVLAGCRCCGRVGGFGHANQEPEQQGFRKDAGAASAPRHVESFYK